MLCFVLFHMRSLANSCPIPAYNQPQRTVTLLPWDFVVWAGIPAVPHQFALVTDHVSTRQMRVRPWHAICWNCLIRVLPFSKTPCGTPRAASSISVKKARITLVSVRDASTSLLPLENVVVKMFQSPVCPSCDATPIALVMAAATGPSTRYSLTGQSGSIPCILSAGSLRQHICVLQPWTGPSSLITWCRFMGQIDGSIVNTIPWVPFNSSLYGRTRYTPISGRITQRILSIGHSLTTANHQIIHNPISARTVITRYTWMLSALHSGCLSCRPMLPCCRHIRVKPALCSTP